MLHSVLFLILLLFLLFLLLLRILLQHAGDLVQAAQWIEEARTMDTADRFVNCKCVKYLLRMNQTDEAVRLASFFTRVSK